MSTTTLVAILFLIPALILINEDFSWEKFALTTVHKVGDKTRVKNKLEELGHTDQTDYEDFRLKQLLVTSLILFPLLLLLLFQGHSFAFIVVCLIGTTALVLFYFEKSLSNQITKQRICIDSDFPSVIEMMTLTLSAGETPLSSLERISKRGSGPLVSELRVVVFEVKSGLPFQHALDRMGRRVQSVAVSRFIDAVVIAISRGAPLIEVLHSHAREAQSFQRNRILGAAAKSEISMMIPVVFLILPISILFALWPSLSTLNLFAES
jgi:tight adherence protein C